MSLPNTYGNFFTTRQDDMAAHDNCPRVLRDAANHAVSYFASEKILERYRGLLRFGQAEACRLIILDMVRLDRKQTRIAYGPTHPEVRA